jgi:hypothetical protein
LDSKNMKRGWEKNKLERKVPEHFANSIDSFYLLHLNPNVCFQICVS